MKVKNLKKMLSKLDDNDIIDIEAGFHNYFYPTQIVDDCNVGEYHLQCREYKDGENNWNLSFGEI